MKQFIYLAALTMLPIVAMGQQQKSFDDEVNTELDRMYEQKGKTAQPAPQINVQQVAQQAPVVQTPVQVVQPQPMYQAPQQPTTVQVQKTTVIEASPLTESRAEKMRKAREETELQTEQKIVEKLEVSRLEDEKRRAEVLFGDKFNSLANGPQQAPAPVAVVAAPVAIAPAPVAPAPVVPVVVTEQKVEAPLAKEDKEPKLDRAAVHEEIKAALDEEKAKNEAKQPDSRKSYFSLTGGMDNYNNTNIKAQGSVGIGFGQKINDRILVEGQFNYGDDHIQQGYGLCSGYSGCYPAITDMQSYQALLEAKYQFFGGVFRPMLGVAAAYTYRHYNDIQFGFAGDTGYSNAIDAGLLIGADAQVSDSFSIGLEARYLWNIVNQTQNNSGLQQEFSYSYNSQTPENMGYMNISLVGRMSF
jgi:outer membrane protein W